MLKNVVQDVQNRAVVYRWSKVDENYIIDMIEKLHYMFGSEGIVDFDLIANFGVDPTDADNYIYLLLDHYLDLFYVEAIELAKEYKDIPLLEELRIDYENSSIYANSLSSKIELVSGNNILEYDSVYDYISYLRR